MKTIEKILKSSWYTKEYLLEQRAWWITNWMWPKWTSITKFLKKLPNFESDKKNRLLDDLDLVSDIHDLAYLKWWWIIDFFKANDIFIRNVLDLFYWTSRTARFFLFIILFYWLNTIWIRYFHWRKIF